MIGPFARYSTTEKEEVPSFSNKFNKSIVVWVHSFGYGPFWIPGSIVQSIGSIMSEIEVVDVIIISCIIHLRPCQGNFPP